MSTVHGDLHPSNVVLDVNANPNLIDFSWCTNEAHILKDFLVMECSIRFFMLPRHLSQASQSLFDEFLLEPKEESMSGAVAALRDSGVDEETLSHLERCARIVVLLRMLAARACGPHFDLRDYLACQALVLYGLMAIQRYPFDVCARALALIGEHLHKTDYLLSS